MYHKNFLKTFSESTCHMFFGFIEYGNKESNVEQRMQ